MKKVILATIMAGLAPILALAQGTVNFQSASLDAYVAYSVGNPVGSGFLAAIYGGAANVVDPNTLTILGGTHGVTPGSGLVIGGGARTNSFVAGGANGTFEVRAWDTQGNTLNTWDAAEGAGAARGRTGAFQNATANPAASPPPTPAFLTGWNSPIIVPEPSTITLAGLGMAALLAFRRRK